ncbi:MAG: M48 family metallopeptidase [Neisseria sp.]|uniref:M48 family metallopeptidase n=1 Tax=Neisseria sp. TaxID=192066 RepID=UPI0026DCC9C9|nr:M48 family metallopeptidase [Neisseria sp.]MDO4640120.1 M48 family metallopeptidase [Neisseria sp.]
MKKLSPSALLLSLGLNMSLGMSVTGCTGVADAVGYDSATLNAAAAKEYTQVVSAAQSKKLIDNTSNTSRRVHAVFNRLKPYANQANHTGVPFVWQMTVIKSNDINAWAMPGGKMAVYTGIVDRLNLTDDEIAAVIGHEMTHALLEHSKKAVGQQVLTGLAANIGGSLLQSSTGVNSDVVSLGTSLVSDIGISKPFSRTQENEADAGGLRLMAQAGYNPQSALTVWEKMNRVEGSNGGAGSLLSTHPSNDTRMSNLRRLLPEVMPIYEKSKRKR